MYSSEDTLVLYLIMEKSFVVLDCVTTCVNFVGRMDHDIGGASVDRQLAFSILAYRKMGDAHLSVQSWSERLLRPLRLLRLPSYEDGSDCWNRIMM